MSTLSLNKAPRFWMPTCTEAIAWVILQSDSVGRGSAGRPHGSDEMAPRCYWLVRDGKMGPVLGDVANGILFRDDLVKD